MTFKEFLSEYLPRKNHRNTHAKLHGLLYDPFGEDLQFVRSVAEQRVWTVKDGPLHLVIEPGVRWIDRLGYIVTLKPWDSDTNLVILE